MTKLVKILTTKLTKLELEKNTNRPAQEGERNPNNPNHYRRHFAPRFIPRERRNNKIQRERREAEDQKVPPPVQNNINDEGKGEEDGQFEDTNQDINHFGELLTKGFLTEEDYLNSEYYDANIFQTQNYLGLEVTSEICQSKPKRTIALRPGPKQVAQNP